MEDNFAPTVLLIAVIGVIFYRVPLRRRLGFSKAGSAWLTGASVFTAFGLALWIFAREAFILMVAFPIVYLFFWFFAQDW